MNKMNEGEWVSTVSGGEFVDLQTVVIEDLLEACKAALEHLEKAPIDGRSNYCGWKIHRKLIDQLRSAIIQAKEVLDSDENITGHY